MIEFWLLLLVILALYVFECFVWVAPGSIAFRLTSNPLRAVRMLTKPRILPHPSIAFGIPFPFRSEIIVASPLPILLSPAGIVPAVAVGVPPARFLAFEDMVDIVAEQKRLIINQTLFSISPSEAQAIDLAQMLIRLKSRSPTERKIEIAEDLARMIDPGVAGLRMKQFVDETISVSLSSLSLLIFTFVLSPIAVKLWGLTAAWRFLLAFVAFNVSLIAWDFYAASRSLFVATGKVSWSSIFTILLSPPTAMRATRYLAKDAACNSHPLAFAAAGSSNEDFCALASTILRDLIFAADIDAGVNDPAADCRQWFRNNFQDAVSQLIRQKGQNPDDLIAAPLRESEQARSYCPRCLSQFLIAEAVCLDCNRVSLKPFGRDS